MNTFIWLGIPVNVKDDYDYFYNLCETSSEGTDWSDVFRALDFCFEGNVSQLCHIGLSYKDIYNKIDGDNVFIVVSEDSDTPGEHHAFLVDKKRKSHPTLRCVGYIDDEKPARWFEHEQLDFESKIVYCVEIRDEDHRQAQKNTF